MDQPYDSLPRGNYIRLLEISGYEHDTPVGKFRIVSLDEPLPEYTAISYSWQGPQNAGNIRLDHGRSLPISRTLSQFFHSLRDQPESYTVWIDALCINQQDLEEKSEQVCLLGKIYSLADHVLVWLGPSTPRTRKAFGFIESKKSLAWPTGWETAQDLSPLRYLFFLFRRRWFRRVWVIQEVMLNAKVMMACGSDMTDLEYFRPCVYAIWKYFEGMGDDDEDDPGFRGFWWVTRLLNLRDQFHASEPVSYETLLELACHSEATDPLDMVYAFQGIGSIADRDRPVPVPNYTASVADVYTETAAALLCHGKSLDLLALAGFTRQNESDLPTWVPDHRFNTYAEPFVMCDGADWDAGGALKISPRYSPPDQLHLQIRVLDTVQTMCPVFNPNDASYQRKTIRKILSLKPQRISQEQWRTTLFRSLTFGLDVDDELPQPEFLQDFEEYLEWLLSSTEEEFPEFIRKNKYHLTLGPRIYGWKAFMTKQELFCIGPPEVKPDHVICTVPGCRLPLILKPDTTTCDRPIAQYKLIGWCYADGLMHEDSPIVAQLMEVVLH